MAAAMTTRTRKQQPAPTPDVDAHKTLLVDIFEYRDELKRQEDERETIVAIREDKVTLRHYGLCGWTKT